MGEYDELLIRTRNLKGQNDESVLKLFNERTIYRMMLTEQITEHPNIVDFTFAEKCFYGRVNRHFVPIKASRGNNRIAYFEKNVNEMSRRYAAFNFVIRAFKDMQKEFQRCAQSGIISAGDKYLSSLKIYKAMDPPDALYNSYFNTYGDSINFTLRNQNARLLDFPDFVRHLTPLVKKSAQAYPVTQCGYMKSRLCPIFASGLAIEIADLPYDDDEQKRDVFFTSPNWKFYVKTCSAFGFMIDMNVPWRLVADIDSLAMKKYSASLAGGATVTSLFLLNYVPVAPYSFYTFKINLLNLYKRCKRKSYVKEEYCGGQLYTKHIIPKNYSIRQFLDAFDDEYFLKIYFQLRFYENEKKYSEAQEAQIIKRLLYYAEYKGFAYALNVFERLIAQTVDYSGSLSYIERRISLLMSETENDPVVDYSKLKY